MNLKICPKYLVTREIVKEILDVLVLYRRSTRSSTTSNSFPVQFETIRKFVEANQAIECVLPAFPAKSPNLNKVLGVSIDKAEEISLYFLNFLCEKIKTIYPPGMKIILCSDGRVFSDVLNISDTNVSHYQRQIKDFIRSNNLSNLKTYDLDHVYPTDNFDSMRFFLMQNYADSIENLERKIKYDSTAKDLYCAMTRFIFEDSLTPENKDSRAQLQKKSKHRAKLTIIRSNAWSNLLEQEFPAALRLSIHPHPPGDKKFGIRLVANENWLTPWHSVALETKDGFKLIKKSHAIKIGAKLILGRNGQPSHYQELS